jgi:hypothetical protein
MVPLRRLYVSGVSNILIRNRFCHHFELGLGGVDLQSMKGKESMKCSLSCAVMAAVLVVSHASGQAKIDDVGQLRKDLAGLRDEVKALKEEVARLTRKDEEDKAARLNSLKDEVARLAKEVETVKAKKHLEEVVKAWGYRTEFSKRHALQFLTIPAVAEALDQKGEAADIPVFSFRFETRLLAPRKNIPNAPRETYKVSMYVDGMLANVPDPGVPFGLDLAGIGQSATDDVRLTGLSRLQSVIWLGASNLVIQDAALKEVSGLKNLRWLDLRGTRVTDAGLKDLAGLKNLQLLDLRGATVTAAGIAELQKALPACRIEPQPDVKWSAAVEGLQCRLRAEKEIWKTGSIPAVRLEVRNQGKRDLEIHMAAPACEIEFDGAWYRWAGPVSILSGTWPAGRKYDDFEIRVTLEPLWQSDAKAIKLTPGKHKIRVAYVSMDRKEPVRVVSNVVEIQIEPAPAK